MVPWFVASRRGVMEIFTVSSLDDELPRACLALLLQRFFRALGRPEVAADHVSFG